MKIVIYSTYPFLLQHLSNQLIVSNKASKVFLEASYGTNQTSKLWLCTKKVNGLQPKTISAKKSTLDVWKSPKQYQLLLWWTLLQILTPPLNLKIWWRTPAPSLITYLLHPTIMLPRTQIFKTGFRKLSILSKFWEWRK